MKKYMLTYLVVGIFFIALLSSGAALAANEQFRARFLAGGGPASPAVQTVLISIENYTTSEEAVKLWDILSTQGSNTFMQNFLGTIKGSIVPLGSAGLKILLHAAHEIKSDQGRQIWLFSESQSLNSQTHMLVKGAFPFLAIELNLNEKGKGKGKIYEQARLWLSPQGRIEIEAFGSAPKEMFSVAVAK